MFIVNEIINQELKMNIVLIHPYITVLDSETYLSEPLGLVCLASYLKNELGDQLSIYIVDLYAMGGKSKKGDYYLLGEDNETIIAQKIKNLAPDLIGITCNFTAYFDDSIEVSKIVKKVLPKVPVVFGGAHASIEAETIFKENTTVDFIIRGEGEITFKELVFALKNNTSFYDIKGLTYRIENKIVSNEKRHLISNLDTLPIPDRSFIDMNFYKNNNKKVIWYYRKSPIATIMTSRGCPYNCIFCSTNIMWEKKWRPRSLYLVFSEIEMLINNYEIKEIIVSDDMFWTNRNRVLEFCDYFIEKKYNISFAVDAGTSSWLIDKELLIKMRKAGFYAIRFPIESGCIDTLKYIRKPVDLDKTSILIKEANKLGFWTSANFIIGFPYETLEQIQQTINYAYNSDLDFASFLIAKLNAGSDLYNSFKAAGLLNQNIIKSSDFYRSDYDTAKMTAADLNDILNKSHSKWFIHKFFYYLKPYNFLNSILPKLCSFEDICYFFHSFVVIFKRKIKPVFIKFIKK